MTDLAGLVRPTVTLPNARLVGETVTGAIPVPVSAAVCGLLPALSVTVNVPLSAPMILGLNTTRMVQLDCLGSVPLNGQVPPFSKKSPPAVTLLIVRAVVSGFLSVAVFAALVVPWACVPNDNVVGVRVTVWAHSETASPKAKPGR